MLERVIMIYLALTTVATAAALPLPVRMSTIAHPTVVPPVAPPDSVLPERGRIAALPGRQSDECLDCDGAAAADLEVEVAGVIEVALDLLDVAPRAYDEDEMSLVGDVVEHDTLLARPAPAPVARGQELADLAADLAGRQYAWGGISPATGFDCSGLVYYVHRQFGLTLGRDTTAQYRQGQSVPRGELEPGDIVFFTDTYTSGVSHDGIYLGDGRFVHAVRPGSGVKITSMSDGYWAPRYLGARRMI